MKAKLGYLCSSESWGGLEMNHLRNAQWMKELGHQVVFFCVNNSPIYRIAEEFGVDTITIEKHKKYFDFSKAKTLTKHIKSNEITHLIIRSTYDMSILAFVKYKLKDKIHTSYFMEMQLGVQKTNLLHTLRFKKIDLWSCPLNWLEKQVKTMTKFSNKTVVIPSGLDLLQFSNLPSKEISRREMELPESTLIFGLIGRFDPQKGQVLLLNAMNLAKNKDFSIIFLGEPTLNEGQDYYKEMEATIATHGLKNRVFIRPFRKDTATFYNAVDFLVMATKAETFGMVTIESLACGTPVLGSNAGGTPEILKMNEGGILFETLNESDLAKQIDFIIDSKKEFDSDKLKAMASVYSHHSICSQVEKALNITAL
ncbi:MAG: glycosyltransferase family 4 protein [Crocinitomicaceae bacterium]|nr:glycosyltransferase family 4 protein [Crocinitomicaceae bacterium]